jgi:zinc protease
MKRSPIPKSAAVACLAMAGAAWAAPVTPVAAAPASKVPQISFEQYTLPNGLRVILSPDTGKDAAPVVSVVVTYDVGSRSEVADRSGFAHLFEHMMFQGSANVAKTEHILLVESNGGTMNGTTDQDRTNFFETLPANQLELGLFLEADRMQSLDISEANLENQRQVVEEEKRQSYDNRPYGGVQEALLDEAYSSFPYKHTTIGSMANLDAATLDDVRNFHKIYYEPNNAVLTVTGRFSPGDAKKLIARYFGPIVKAATPPPTVFSEPTVYPGERRKTLQDPLARQTRYTAGYVTVPGNDPDFYPLSLLGDILSSGKTSRLYQALVEKDLATNAGAGEEENMGPGLFQFNVGLPNGVDVSQVEPVLDAEIARVQTDGVTDEELETAKVRERVDAIRGLQTSMGRAQRLGLYAVIFHDPNRVNTLLPSLESVTAADVQRVAKKYLVKDNRSVVISQPAGAAPAAQGGTQ